MEDSGDLVRLTELCEGMCEAAVVVKVDRIICKEVVRYPLGRPRPMKELQAVQLIVFDKSMTRNIVVLDEDTVIDRLAPMFGEDRCYKLSNFLVRRSGEGSRVKLYIKILPTSHVEFTDADFPRHCFNLRTVLHLLSCVHNAWGIVDVCGMLKNIVEPGLGQSSGIVSKEVVLLLEDSGVLSVGTDKVLSCTLQGESADTTIRAYEAVSSDDNIFVLIQYALVIASPVGSPSLMSFHNATRVFFNPDYPEVREQRIAMLHRLLPDPNSATLPVV